MHLTGGQDSTACLKPQLALSMFVSACQVLLDVNTTVVDIALKAVA